MLADRRLPGADLVEHRGGPRPAGGHPRRRPVLPGRGHQLGRGGPRHPPRRRAVPVDLPVEPRNQARVHLWFERRFGAPCPPLPSALAGIDRVLFPALRLGVDAAWRLYAPDGLEDTLAAYLSNDDKSVIG